MQRRTMTNIFNSKLYKLEPDIKLAKKYEKIEEWFCDYCHADQVYVGGGRMMCAESDCDNFFGKDDAVEHMTGSYAHMNGRLFNIIMRGDMDKMSDEIIDNYKGAWAYATTDQLIEELEIVYREGVKGLKNMDYEEILRESQEQE